MKADNIWTIIPSGGEGTRLRPFTSERSKPMVPMINNFPILEILLYSLAYSGGLRNFIFGVKGVKHYTNIHNYFQGGYGWGAKLGLTPQVHFEYQYPHYQDNGSADSVLYNIKSNNINDPIIVLPCDNFLRGTDLITAYEAAQKTDYLITVLLTKYNDVSQFGLVDYNKKTHQITNFIEKPSHLAGQPGLINTGAYIIKPEAFKYLEKDFGKDVLTNLTPKGLVGGHVIKHEWYDFGNPEVHLESVLSLMADMPPCLSKFLERICTIIKTKDAIVYARGKGPVSIKNSNRILAQIKSKKIKVKGCVFIGKDCLIEDGSYLENCLIGDLSRIGKDSTISNSNLFDVWEVGEKSLISGTFGGRGCKVGSNSILKNSYIGDDTVIGNKCRLTNVSTKNGSRIPQSQNLKNINGEFVI